MREGNKYISLSRIALKDTLHYPMRALSELCITFVRVAILVILYSYAYHYLGRNINGITLQIGVWSIGIYFILLSFNARRIFQDINEDIISGKIEMLVNKPIGYLTYKVSMHFGYNLLNGIMATVGMFVILNTFVGPPALLPGLVWWLEVLVLSILGLILAYLVYIIVALAAFWLNNAAPVYWIVDKTILILGGSYIPVALFPHSLQLVARYSPFGATMFATYIFYPNFATDAFMLILIQMVWMIVAFIFVKLLYAAAEKKLTINGG